MRFFALPEDLAPYFTTFIRFDIDVPKGRKVTEQLQPEWGTLRFFTAHLPSGKIGDNPALSGARFVVSGPSSRPTHFSVGRTRMWGIGLLPLGWTRFVGVKASNFADTLADGETTAEFAKFAPLCAHLCRGPADDDRQFAALVSFFRGIGREPRNAARLLAVHAARVDPGQMQVADLAATAGVPKRTLERLCLRHFGFSPHVLLRRQRLMRSLSAFMLDTQSTWSDAIDRQYHDQSHFVHEFHSFMGVSPSEYVEAPRPIMTAIMTERQRVMGSAVQTLDKPK
ncbi:helix-turn-helix domain-containing protein [Qipengyuania marisflavi]|nr:helix-turn-helix domain-containing protein [Qipengyuania marisflavi]